VRNCLCLSHEKNHFALLNPQNDDCDKGQKSSVDVFFNTVSKELDTTHILNQQVSKLNDRSGDFFTDCEPESERQNDFVDKVIKGLQKFYQNKPKNNPQKAQKTGVISPPS
jgi:hypothetical protein